MTAPILAAAAAAAFLAAGGCGGQEPLLETTVDATAEVLAGVRFMNYCDPGRAADRPSLTGSWYDPEPKVGGGTCAWMRGERAGMILECDTAAGGRLLLGAYSPDDGNGPRRLSLTVNGRGLGEAVLPARPDTVGFRVPAGALRRGANDLRLVVDRAVSPCGYSDTDDCRDLGAQVDWVFFRPDHAADPAPRNDPREGLSEGRLDAGSFLRLGAATLSGAGLHLTWDGAEDGADDSLEVTAGAGDRMWRLAFAAADDSLRLELPDDLPRDALLDVRLTGPRSAPPTGSVALTGAGWEWRQRRLNVVLIIIDTLRADRLSCYGADSTSTPRIDELAADGVLFANCVSQAPITGPSHAALFTSRLPTELGFVNNGQRIDPGTPVLAEFLARRGYDVRGAISLGTMGRDGGFDRGFAEYDHVPGFAHISRADSLLPRCLAQIDRLRPPFFAFWHFSDPHEPYNANGMVEREAEVLLDGEPVTTFPTSTYTPQRIPLSLPGRESILTVRSDDGFYVRVLEMAAARGRPPEIERDKSRWNRVKRLDARIGAAGERAAEALLGVFDMPGGTDPIRLRYSREVEYVDAHVGALLDTLRARGLYDDSLVILAADHGEDLGEHHNVGHVQNLYRNLVRVPLIIKPPRGRGPKPGARVVRTVGLIDVLPTVLGAIGAPIPGWARGTDLLAGDPPPDRALFSETHRPEAYHDRCSLTAGRYKVIRTLEPPRWELYDVRKDPDELENLFRDGDDLSERWRQELLAVLTGIEPPAGGDTDGGIDETERRKLEALGY